MSSAEEAVVRRGCGADRRRARRRRFCRDAGLKRDAVVCAVGAAEAPDRRELDDEAMRGAVVVESREASAKEPGDILMAKAEVSGELGELLNGAAIDSRKGRPVVFKSVGIAIEDIAAAESSSMTLLLVSKEARIRLSR